MVAIGERIMYHEEYNTFIQLNLLRVYISYGGLKLARGDHFGCQNQSGGPVLAGEPKFSLQAFYLMQ